MTNSQNIAICGAGIMGLSAAYALSRSGHNITLFDPAGFPARNASFIAGGMLAPYSEIDHMGAEWLEPCFASIDLWAEMAETLGGNIEFQSGGSLIIAHEQDRHSLARFEGYLPKNDANITQIHAGDVEPTLTPFGPALSLQGEASLHPAKTMAALCAYLQGHIAFKNSAAMPKEIAADYDAVIDCRGMAAKGDLPELRGVKGEIVVVRNEEFILSRPVRLMHPRYPLYIVPREDQHFMIGASIIESAEHKAVSLHSAMELMSALYSLHPSFAEAQIIEIAADIRPSFPDNLPKIIRRGNIIHCNGLYRHGYLLAPIMAETLAAMMAGEAHKFESFFTRSIKDETDDNKSNNQRRNAAIHRAA